MKNFSQLIRHNGNSSLFDILEISVLGTLGNQPVHVHAEGLRGTGKTTIMRGYKEILPKINRIKGCIYNCDPKNPICPEHRNLSFSQIHEIGIEQIDMPFLEISASAKKSTVVGSIDLKKITSKEHPEAALKPGTIAMANRGIIFIDEINRIADISPEIADVLLNVMGTKPGRIQIEETGLPTVELPVQVSVWAASNPDEDPGPLEDIRRQLSDRFDFTVYVERPTDPAIIKSILDSTPKFVDETITAKKRQHIMESYACIENYIPGDKIKNLLASLYIDFNLESLRGVEALLLGLKLRGALLKTVPDWDDVLFLSKWAMKHRTDHKNLIDILNFIEQSAHKTSKSKETEKYQDDVNNQESCSEKLLKTSTTKKQKYDRFSVSPLRKILSKLTKFTRTGSSKGISQTTDIKNMKIQAPPRKAISLKELLPNEYVNTEEELK